MKIHFILPILLVTIFVSSLQTRAQNIDSVDIFSLSIEQLMQIDVVTVSKKSQKISETPATITVITAEQIRQRGYTNLSEILNSVAGIHVITDHLQSNAGIRGINGGMDSWSRGMKIMIDNQPVSFRSTNENWLGNELIAINSIERVEIVKGPVSAIYGANAFLGVVNIITKSGEIVNGGILDAQALMINNNFGVNGEIVVGKKLENFDFLLSYSKKYADMSGVQIKNMPNFTSYYEANESKTQLDRAQSLYGNMNFKSEKVGNFNFNFSRQMLDNNANFMNWSILSDSNRVSMSNSFAKIKYENFALDNSLSYNISMAYSTGLPNSKQTMVSNVGVKPENLKRDVSFRSVDISTEMAYNTDKNDMLLLGFDHTIDNQNLQTYYKKDATGNYTIPLQSKVYGDSTFINSALYLHGIIYLFKHLPVSILENLSVTGGLRFDKHNIYGNNWSYRMGMVFPFSNNFYGKLLYGNSFKAPASVQLYTNAIYTTGMIGNAGLKPEKAQTVELIFGGTISEYFSFNLSPFYTTIKNKVEIVPFQSNYMAKNIAEINTYGLETEMQFANKYIFSYANVSFQNSTIKEQDPFNIQKTIEKKTRIYPDFMAKFGCNVLLNRWNTNLNLEGRFHDKIIASPQNLQVYDPVYNTKEYNLSGYLLFDISVSSLNVKIFSTHETFLQFKVSNLLNTTYYMPGYKDYDTYGLKRSFMFRIIQYL